MAWLIEAFLDEEMKTAEDFKKKKENEDIQKAQDVVSAANRDARKTIARGRKEELEKSMKDAEEGKYDFKKAIDNERKKGYLSKEVDKAMDHKYGKDWEDEVVKNGTKVEKEGPDSISKEKRDKLMNISKDVIYAQDAKERHDRKKAVGESHWLFENTKPQIKEYEADKEEYKKTPDAYVMNRHPESKKKEEELEKYYEGIKKDAKKK